MKYLIPLALLLAGNTAPGKDPRLATRAYNPDEVVRIEGRAGVQATIAFREDEHIENVAIGDSNLWQVTPNRRANLLFVKPMAPRARTNMTVVTDRHTYYFDLSAAPSAQALYQLRFTYPNDPVQAAAKPATINADEAGIAKGDPAALPKDPASLNFAWKSKGKPGLLPERIFDDGSATYISWAAGKPLPAILVRSETGAEGPVNFAVRGDTIVVDGVPAQIILRSGRNEAILMHGIDAKVPKAADALAVAPQAKPEGH